MRITVKVVGIGKIEVDLNKGETVGDLLNRLFQLYPNASNRFRNSETGEVYSYVNIWVGDRSVRQLQGLQTRLNPGDSLTIFLPSAGG